MCRRSSSCSNPLWSVKGIISRHLGCYFLCCTSFLTYGQHNEYNAQDSHWHISLLCCLRDLIWSGMWHWIDPETQTVLGGSRSAPDKIREPSRQAITPTNGCGDKSAFSHMAMWEIWPVSVMVNGGKEIPTVSSLGHPDSCGKKGAFYGPQAVCFGGC